jgi:hypothetical protein
MSDRIYTLNLTGGSDDVRRALNGYQGRRYQGDMALRQAREVTVAIELLFPDVRCRIVSQGRAVTPAVKVLRG